MLDYGIFGPPNAKGHRFDSCSQGENGEGEECRAGLADRSLLWRPSTHPQRQWFWLHQAATYLERQTQFGDIPWPGEGSAGAFLDSTQPVADRVRVA